jgi:beta-N-acetylhexosaminidase
LKNPKSTCAPLICAGFEGLAPAADVRDLLARGVRSVVLFSRNYQTPDQLRALCADVRAVAGPQTLIAVDHEGGRVQRFREGFTPIPSMRELGQSGDPEIVRHAGATMAQELRRAGVNWNLAPVVDVDSNPANPVIGQRSFGPEMETVSRMGVALIRGLQEGGVAACAKHFPGHGDTSVDSHHDLPYVGHQLERLTRVELPPFQAAIEAEVASIMVAHLIVDVIDPTTPASMSHAAVQGLLRARLGYDGLVTTDDLEMKAVAARYTIEEIVTASVRAGVDLCMICHTLDLQHRAIEALDKAVADGRIETETIERARRRVEHVCRRFRVPE